jgi:hypothetical protein
MSIFAPFSALKRRFATLLLTLGGAVGGWDQSVLAELHGAGRPEVAASPDVMNLLGLVERIKAVAAEAELSGVSDEPDLSDEEAEERYPEVMEFLRRMREIRNDQGGGDDDEEDEDESESALWTWLRHELAYRGLNWPRGGIGMQALWRNISHRIQKNFQKPV